MSALASARTATEVVVETLASGTRDEPQLPRWLGPLVIASIFAALLLWSLGKWSDVQVDFGVELYVPWQITEGQALYRDLATRNGPLSHHVNALWFTLFGVSLRTLVIANLVILAGITALLFRLFARACGQVTATGCCLVFLGLFGFSQYTVVGNYNYVTPYHHHQTHAVALTLLMLLAFDRGLRTRTAGGWALGGLCLGAIFLTKAELFVPALVAACVPFALAAQRAGGLRELAAPLGAAALAACVFPSAFFVGLAAQMPTAQAFEGVLGNWAHLGRQLLSDAFYLRTLGLDDWPTNAAIALGVFGGLAAFAAALAAADLRVPERLRRPQWMLIAGLAMFALLTLLPIRWVWLSRALPVVAAISALPLLLGCARAIRRGDALPRTTALAAFAVWALVLLGKVLLNVRFGQYGFVLAMPATLLLTAWAVSLGPSLLAGAPGTAGARGRLFRSCAAALMAACVLSFLTISNSHYRAKTMPVGRGNDQMFASFPPSGVRAKVIVRALAELQQLMRPGATLLVWPEGAGINYWLRRRSPSRFSLFLPTEVEAFGEVEMLADLDAHPPDWIALLHRDHLDFGAGPFGSETNGRAFIDWIDANYERRRKIGGEPFQTRGSGIVLLQRSDR